MPTPKKSDGTKVLTTEVRELREAVDKSYRYFKRVNQYRHSLALSFLKGVSSTLGALVTVVIVTPLIILLLRSIAWPPLIADLVANVILQYEQVNRQSQRAVDGQ
ncbi:MAG: hypothetical protein KBA40_00510 [Candidatus Peribacteraceae bacterium]|nr:hypothetical protein [Candidatus Peribacteraceae bacterium]MBP9850133.1 hypothetical protein [Candidatus Peribacteraceae bacterium]